MIRLVSGLPGAGKSLRLVELIQKYLAEGRPVYVDGLDGLKPFGWEPCNASEWQSLPDGSVVVLDEAQKRWPTRRAGEPPEYIRALSEHRHHGFDFVLATQHPTMLDKYVRTLVGEHQHVLRQFGTGVARVVTWTECQDDPQSLPTRLRGTDAVWRHPKKLFELYHSASVHTVKRKLPVRMMLLPVLAVVAAVMLWLSVRSVGGIAHPKGAVDATAASSQSYGRSSDDKPHYDSPAAYVKAFLPRVPGMPWSAPGFDDRKVKAEPDILCVQSETKGCTCYTEQITRLEIPILQCLRIARYGIYNPFRQPFRPPASQPTPGGPPPPAAAQAAPYKELPPVAVHDAPATVAAIDLTVRGVPR